MRADYRHLSLSGLASEFEAMALDADAAFGRLNERRLNWRPEATRWSVGQCFDHLLSSNEQMFRSMDAAMDSSHRPTLWQRLPILPRAFGRMLIASQGPDATRKFTAPRQAQPSSSAIDAEIMQRFVASQHEAASRMRALDGRDVARIMVSPFASVVTYSVLDGCRIVVAHQRRHFEQARRVMQAPGFPVT